MTWQYTELDHHLAHEGTHTRLHERLGAFAVAGSVPTVRFAVYAPRAVAVDVAVWRDGDDPMGLGDRRVLRRHRLPDGGDTGVWTGEVEELGHGDAYRFVVHTAAGEVLHKADPFARWCHVAPDTRSRVWAPAVQGPPDGWSDGEWMARRGSRQALDAPMIVEEVHAGSFRRAADGTELGFRGLTAPLIDHLRGLGATHVELMPVLEHPFGGSWGYQLTGYFAPAARWGSPADLAAFVDALHREGLGVWFDWPPAHFPDDPHGLARFDGEPLFEHPDPQRGHHPDWDSCIFDYGSGFVRSFLRSSAHHLLGAFHGDGLRVDAVASMLYLDYSRDEGEWTPNEQGGREHLEAVDFLQQLNAGLYAAFPDTQLIAEESTAWSGVTTPVHGGGLGFGLKWDLGWMHDTLAYLGRDPVHRAFHHHELTFRGVYQHAEHFVLPLSHDEVVHGKGSLRSRFPGDPWQQFATLRSLFAWQTVSPGKVLRFMGSSFGQWHEWNHDGELAWHERDEPLGAGVERCVADLNRALVAHGALHRGDPDPGCTQWVLADASEDSAVAVLRFDPTGGPPVLGVCHFTPVPRFGVRVGVPSLGLWREVVNTDARIYGGSGMGHGGAVEAEPQPWQGQPASVVLTLPPLGSLILVGPEAA